MKLRIRNLLPVAIALLICGLYIVGLAETGPAVTVPEESVAVEEKGLVLGESSVLYPSLTGMADPDLQGEINSRILENTRIPEYLTRVSQLISGGRLQVAWSGGLLNDVFSCAVSAEGMVETVRPTHVWTWSNVDLRDGHEIALEELFTDASSARTAMETCLEETVAPDLSAHLANSAVTPLPEGFCLDAQGLTFLYPVDQLSTLSDRAGAVRLSWNELQPLLDLTPDSLADRLGVSRMITLNEESAEALRLTVAAGALPGIPVQLGDALRPLTDCYHLLMDPEVEEGGRLFSLEGAAFRDVLLLTDFLTEEWDHSVVQGIRMTRGCLWGLRIGQTCREEWLQYLGEPDSTVLLDEARAEARRTVPGSCDYYAWGDHLLLIGADESGLLVSLTLTE